MMIYPEAGLHTNVITIKKDSRECVVAGGGWVSSEIGWCRDADREIGMGNS